MFPALVYLLALITLLSSNFSSAQTENDILFWKAVQDNNIHEADSFISLGVDLNVRNKEDWTPLFVAAYYGYIEIAELLIQNGADIHSRSNDAKTPLFAAVENKHIVVARSLLNAGAETEVVNSAGRVYCTESEVWTSKKDIHYCPLHIAVFCNDLEMVKLLLEYGANVNAQTEMNWTPIMIAASLYKTEIFIELYINKADLGIQNSEGQTALTWIDYYEYGDIHEFLKNPQVEIQKRFGNLPVLTTSLGHADRIVTAEFSKDGKYMVTGSLDNTVKLWDMDLRKEIRTFYGLPDVLSTLTCDFKNNLLVASDQSDMIKIWNLSTGVEIATFSESLMIQIALSSDNKFMLTANVDCDIKLWDLEKKEKIKDFDDHGFDFSALFFDQNNQPFLAEVSENTVSVWNLTQKKAYRSFSDHTDDVTAIAVSLDNRYLVAGSWDHSIKAWNIETEELINEYTGHPSAVTSISFSSDNNQLVASSYNGIITVWDVHSGALIKEIRAGESIETAEFVNNDKNVASICRSDTLKVWNLATGELVNTHFLGQQSRLNALALPYEDNVFISGNLSEDIKTWSVEKNNRIEKLPIDFRTFTATAFSPNNTFLITGDKNGSVCQWDLETGELMKSFPDQTGYVYDLDISSDGKKFLSLIGDEIGLWDIESGNNILNFIDDQNFIVSVSFNPTDDHIYYGGADSLFIYDIGSGKIIKSIGEEYTSSFCWEVSQDENIFIAGTEEQSIYIWDLDKGDMEPIYYDFEPIAINAKKRGFITILEYSWTEIEIKDLDLSSDNRYIAAGLTDNSVRILDIEQKYISEIKVLTGHSGHIRNVAFTSGDKYLITSSEDKTIKIWETARWKEVATLISVGEDDWIVTTPEGLFDASPNAMKLIYYTQGFEIFELSQLKDRYYEPGLLQKILGFNDEPVRDVTNLDKLDLYPEIKLNQHENGLLEVDLSNRGGGIGPVKIFINGKEIAADARGEGSDPDAENLNISLDLKNHPYLKSDAENIIEVKAANGEGYLVSRGAKVAYYPEEKEPAEIPRLFIVASGISDYTGDEIDLKYAAKDAEDMASALEIGAKRLFGVDKTFTYLLTTNQDKSSLQPARVNLIRTFEEIAQKAKSTDILVLYFSGHGINWGGQDGDFYYLTKDAYTAEASAYNDPAIRGLSTISSNEMVEYIKKIPALKQVLIIDACASGKMVENLVTQRNISSSTLRALDRMKDRTGMHIITGCTADAVSYEASRYGQGVLTYSLLEGIKGTALRDERFVDVNLLYQYARERVPELAEGIGGIQKPEVFSPYGAESFDIGEVNSTDKEDIPLARIKPVFVRSVFQDEDELEDVLGLSAIIDDMLNEISQKGNGKSLIFVNAREFPDSYKLSGLYSQQENKITLKMKIRSKELSESFIITGANMEELKLNILSQINSTLN
ncbi:MAG: ankyrin repeat domain-containing protein [Bacteroidales bacterium]|nr:ankyrin repeat domain-containing protein [Bacteroidales bacterium]